MGYDTELTLYCNYCGKTLADAAGYVRADSKAYLSRVATKAGWSIQGNEATCPDCRTHKKESK